MLAVLAEAGGVGEPLSALVATLPARATASARLEQVPEAASRELLARLDASEAARDALGARGRRRGASSRIDRTDGLRMTLASGEILHLRPSGNAPELRCYAEAGDAARAEALAAAMLAQVAARMLAERGMTAGRRRGLHLPPAGGDAEHTILAGHCWVEAAKLLGMATVPCIRIETMTTAEKRAYVLANNKLALNAAWATKLLLNQLPWSSDPQLLGLPHNESGPGVEQEIGAKQARISRVGAAFRGTCAILSMEISTRTNNAADTCYLQDPDRIQA